MGNSMFLYTTIFLYGMIYITICNYNRKDSKMIFINDQAYMEFKELLDKAEAETYNVRIGLDRVGCSGPIFNVYIDEPTMEDDVEKINDISFIVEKSLNRQYGGFIIVSSEENNGNGVGLKPVVQPEKTGCGSCGMGCGSCGEDCR